MGSIFREKIADTTKTTCIEITAESYKCIDISAFVPQCITITSNVPTSELYQEQYDRDPVEVTEAPQLQIALINNEAPILNVNMDADGVYYVTDFDTVYIDITNWNANAEYVNVFSNEDGNDAVVFLDEENERIIWSLDDYALDGTQMWLYAQAKESDKLLSPQSNVTVTQMEQTDQPNLSSWVSQYENTVLNITILDYDATYTYADPIVTGGTAIRTDNVIAWTLPDVTEDTYHEISIAATAPLMYESLAGVSGGSVAFVDCAIDWSAPKIITTDRIIGSKEVIFGFHKRTTTAVYGINSIRYLHDTDLCNTWYSATINLTWDTYLCDSDGDGLYDDICLTNRYLCYAVQVNMFEGICYISIKYSGNFTVKDSRMAPMETITNFLASQVINSHDELNSLVIGHMGFGTTLYVE